MTDDVSSVVRIDFGKDDRESARRLSRLLNLAEQREADILANPKRYLDQAHDEIIRLRRLMVSASDALRRKSPDQFISDKPPRSEPMQTVMVPAEDYERMNAIEAIMFSEEWPR